MKNNRLFLPIGLLLFLALCLVPGQAQQGTPLSLVSGEPFQLGLAWPSVTAGSGSMNNFTVSGLQYYMVQWVVNGTVSACSVTVDGGAIPGGSFSTGSIVSSQTCTSTGVYTTTSATQNVRAQLTYSITGSGSVTFVLLGYTQNPSSGGGSSVTIVSPVDGSGYVNVDCKTGCSGSSAITTWGGGTLGAMANYGTSPGAVLVPGVNAFITNIPAVTQSGTWSTRTQDGAGNALTSNSSTYTSKFGLDVNLLGADGTAFGTAGVLDQNVKNVGGNAVATGTGASGNGVARVTVSNDSSEADDMVGTVPGTAPSDTKIVGTISNTAAPSPSNGQTLPLQSDGSGNLYVAFRTTTNGCTSNNSSFASTPLNLSGSTLTQLIALAAGKKIYICGAYLQGGGTTPTIEFEYGTGTNCATGTTILTQPVALTTAAPGIMWTSPGPVVPVGDALCYILTGTTPTVVGWLTYVQ
jgi:hypothetical protein